MKKQTILFYTVIMALFGLISPISAMQMRKRTVGSKIVLSKRIKQSLSQTRAKRHVHKHRNIIQDNKNFTNKVIMPKSQDTLMQLSGLSLEQLRENGNQEVVYDVIYDHLVNTHNTIQNDSVALTNSITPLREAIRYVEAFNHFYGKKERHTILLQQSLNEIKTDAAQATLEYIADTVEAIQQALNNQTIQSMDRAISILEQEINPIMQTIEQDNIRAIAPLIAVAKNRVFNVSQTHGAHIATTKLYTDLLETLDNINHLVNESEHNENTVVAYRLFYDVAQKFVNLIGKPFKLIMHAKDNRIYRGDKIIDHELSIHREILKQYASVTTASVPSEPVDKNEDLPQKEEKKKSWISKNFSKIAAGVIGVALVGAYEWFAENNPETVSPIGIRNMINTVLSWFGFGATNNPEVTSNNQTPESFQNTVNSDANNTTTSTITTTSTSTLSNATQSTEKITLNGLGSMVEDDIAVVESVSDEEEEKKDGLSANVSFTVNTPITSMEPKSNTAQSTKQESNVTQPEVNKFANDDIDEKAWCEGMSYPDSSEEDDIFESLSSSEEDEKEIKETKEINQKPKPTIVPSATTNISISTYDPVIEHKDEQEKVVITTQPKEVNGTVQMISAALDKLIEYTGVTGEWFVDLFSTKHTASFNKHVDIFGETIRQMEEEMKKCSSSNNDSIIEATKSLGLFLIGQLNGTGKVLNSYKGYSSGFLGRHAVSLAWQLKNLNNDMVKMEKNTLINNLKKELTQYPELNAKVTRLQKTMSNYGDQIETKAESELLKGLSQHMDRK